MIGKTVRTRMLLDTGASRNIIRTGFRRTLAASEDVDAREALKGPFKGEKKISIAGIHSGSARDSSNDITCVSDLELRFVVDQVARGPKVVVQFGEMESCTDDLVIGCPQLMEWGLSICQTPGSSTPTAHLMKPNIEVQIVKWFPNPQLSTASSTAATAGSSASSRVRGRRPN